MTTHRMVISPHPDDAAWSCGGAIARWIALGDSVTVVTVFDGDAPQRRREDSVAFAGWPVGRVCLGLPEAMARHDAGRPRYRSALALRRRPHRHDRDVAAQTSAALRPLLATAGVVVAPVGAGTHVDHTIARQAVDQLCPPARRSYYTEFPYAAPPPDSLTGTAIPVDFQPWLRAALCYPSQIEAMFGGPISFARRLRHHAGMTAGGAAHCVLWLPPEGVTAAPAPVPPAPRPIGT